MKLAEKGYGRQRAHRLIRKLAFKTMEENTDFKSVLLSNDEIMKLLSKEEIDELFDPNNYINVAKKRVNALLKHTERILNIRIFG